MVSRGRRGGGGGLACRRALVAADAREWLSLGCHPVVASRPALFDQLPAHLTPHTGMVSVQPLTLMWKTPVKLLTHYCKAPTHSLACYYISDHTLLNPLEQLFLAQDVKTVFRGCWEWVTHNAVWLLEQLIDTFGTISQERCSWLVLKMLRKFVLLFLENEQDKLSNTK